MNELLQIGPVQMRLFPDKIIQTCQANIPHIKLAQNHTDSV